MTVGELIKILEGTDPNRLVVISGDAEGNKFSPMDDGFSDMMYLPESKWSGTIGFAKLTAELRADGWEEDDLMTHPDAVPCCVFWPTN